MVIGYHLIWTAYGWWLPNDPRGSTSHFVESDVIFELGNLHHGRKKVQPAGSVIRAFYEQAATRLKHELLTFGASEVRLISQAFAEVCEREAYTCYACAIMPDHVHVLIRKHKHLAEQMILNLQDHSRMTLRNANLRPDDHPVWGGSGWKVFLDHPEDIERTIRYIEDNPIKLCLPRQQWPFVRPYDGWPSRKVRAR